MCFYENKRVLILMTIEFAQNVSTFDQRPETTDPVAVAMDQNDAISGIEHSSNNPTDIVIAESGTYVMISAPQAGRLSGDKPGHIDFWLRKNNRDIPNSNVRASISVDEKDVIVNQTMMTFNSGDVLNVMMAVSHVGDGLGVEAIQTEGRPLIPSIIFSMHKIKDSVEGHWVSTQKGTKKMWIES